MSRYQSIIDQKTKPLGSLGQLESIALKIAHNQQADTLTLTAPHMLVFAGDHGISQHNISIAPSDVTALMMNNFLQGGAAINCFARTLGWQLQVIDCGTLTDIDHPQLIKNRLDHCCGDISIEPALTQSQWQQTEAFTEDYIKSLHQTGCNIVGFGEMGIGNTSPAAAIAASLLNRCAADTVGVGTGITDSQLAHKQQLVQQALDRFNNNNSHSPLDTLLHLGSFEIAHLVAAMLSAKHHKMLMIIDGFIVTAAAMLAIKINPDCQKWMIFAHCSKEQAHKAMLESLNELPLLDLGLRLGEGTGAALALPLIQSAVSFYNDMASFSDLGIEL
ncbi:nicotinate-nucleotide--dimethylbenzimidazole phosphoribosyltransferase [Pseudoalteromonas ulvae]|uniref:Nicotinate-nucleotide--dimethylbenzimidazole phosphoribosyltransferase n=1 Tax=Pseudoalteromonas ulvae TaxID=107327 RepID=A0A244CML6_PSEDV|nr:nicotinate-nucleotide--dimethylbenzimidazole phosphoribosyltransferase [Pseudoalteromonas ulvae]OUL56853.1 nicotinate-nucleotide--dimethylbenzimidazole phosphoribosyltransferase [Pseudoalteromonas ulvae]